jgi:hypothetical protein
MLIDGKMATIHNEVTFKDDFDVELGTNRKKVVNLPTKEFWIK